MEKCVECGSYAINLNKHGRGEENPELCDVCYWKMKYFIAIRKKASTIRKVTIEEILRRLHSEDDTQQLRAIIASVEELLQ